jgi:hypothetical protein
VEQGDFDRVAGFLAEDFTLTGPVPMPLAKGEFLGLVRGLVAGIPNWRFNTHGWQETGDSVSVKVRITGTHTGELPGLMPGMPAAAATNKSFALPEECMEFQFRGGKIARFQVDPVPNGGVPGILQQLGIAVPVR